MNASTPSNSVTPKISAIHHIDPEGSLVHSGVLLADAVLEQLKTHAQVTVSMTGFRGASSSYFNVFLRRLKEECGEQELESIVKFEFDTKLQEMVYTRSRQALHKGPHQPSRITIQVNAAPPATSSFRSGKWLLRWFSKRA